MHVLRRLQLASSGRSLVLGDVLARLAELRDTRPLVEEPRALRLTYREGAERVDRLAAGMAARVEPGERVVVATPNGYDQLLCCMAAARVGAVAVPVNDRMRPEEVDHVVADSGAALVVRSPAEVLAGAGPDVAELDRRRPGPDAVAALFYTSGTTGVPKGARLTHRALLGQLGLLALAPTELRRDELIASLPVAHIMGFSVLLAAAVAGIPVFALPRFRAGEVLDAIERRRSTIFVGVPAMYRLLLEAGAETRDLTSIRVWASGADVMPAELARRFQRMGATVTLPLLQWSVGDAAFVEGYGLVETAGAVAARVSPPGLAVPIPLLSELLGLPLPGNRLRVVDAGGRRVRWGRVGELAVRGPGVLAGYHGDPSASAAILGDDGWLHTGDLVRRGPFGSVHFVGRSKEVIKTGGYSVYPAEIERVMEEHPAVAEAAVLGLPDDHLGERTVAAVRLLPGSAATEEELLDWGGVHLAGYKRPRQVRVVAELPRTGTDKVARRQLEALFAS